MARWAKSWGTALFVAGLGLGGCNKHEDADAPRAVAESTTSSEAPKDKPPTPAANSAAFGDRDPLHQPFTMAAYTNDAPPEDAKRPPDDTISGKPTFALLSQVRGLWETIRFTTPDGKAIEYTAVVETDQGNIEIELRPDAAPNHVRSFVALAMAGYFDRLLFDHIRREEPDVSDATPSVALEQLEAGNPRGIEEVNGTIGYWLPLEPSKSLTHEAGTVGACLEDETKCDGCRFYITLSKAPYLDGNFTAFGKVKTGLDVARRMYAQPVVTEDRERDGLRRPEKPVVIKKVTIQTRVAGSMEGTK